MTLSTFIKTLLLLLGMQGVLTRSVGRDLFNSGVSLTCADPFTSKYPYQELICKVPGGGGESSIYWQIKYVNSSLYAGFYCGREGCDTMDDAYQGIAFQRVGKLLTSTLKVRSGPMDGDIDSISCWGKSDVDNRWFKSRPCPTVYGTPSLSMNTQTVIVDQHVDTSSNDLTHYRIAKEPNEDTLHADCILHGEKKKHGSIFMRSYENPCWLTKCHNGKMFDLSDGCYREGQCYPIDRKFTINCKTMICRKTQTGPDTYRYSQTTSRTHCEAVNGYCRPVGSTGFSAVVKGTVMDNCECMWGALTQCKGQHTPNGQG